MFGFNRVKCRLGNTISWSSDSAALTSPSRPAPDSMCPKFVFADPTYSGCASERPGPYTFASALISIGSPTGVPVPCASTYPIAFGSTPTRARAVRITFSCV